MLNDKCPSLAFNSLHSLFKTIVEIPHKITAESIIEVVNEKTYDV